MAITKISSALIGANTIATSNIADNAVDGSKIAQNSILTKHIDDNQIVTSHIADDAVTLAKMDGLARGKIIYGDASGNPAALALGSNGTVLKSDGTDIAWGTDATVAALTSEEVQDITGAMFSSNTETGITATYQDADGTIDLVVGTLNQNTTGSAATLTTARAIAVAGAVTGTVNFDGSAAVSITTTLANNAVLTQHIDDNQVTTDQIAANTIATGNIADNAVDGTKIASNSILTRHIDDDQVTGAQLADTLNIVTALGINGSPAEKLHVTGGNLKMSGTSDGSNGIILLYSASGAESGQIYPHGGDLKIYSPNDVLFTGDELHDFAGFINVAKSARIAQVDLSSSSNAVAWDSVAAANAYHVTTENTTFSAPSNSVQGAVISVELAQGSTARTIAWNTVFEFAASTAPTVTATASKTDIFTFRYNGSVWQEIGRVQNMAQT